MPGERVTEFGVWLHCVPPCGAEGGPEWGFVTFFQAVHLDLR